MSVQFVFTTDVLIYGVRSKVINVILGNGIKKKRGGDHRHFKEQILFQFQA